MHLAVQQFIHHEGLEPRIPGAAGLGGPRVHLGGAERDLPGVAQHGLTQFHLTARCGKLVDLGFHHVDDDADHLHGLLQRHGAG